MMKDGLTAFREYFMPTYAPYAAVFTGGEGTCLYDADGRRWLDFCAGIAVNNVGHCHPAVVRAIREQAGKLMHVSNLYLHENELALAERLEELTFPGRLFLCQSGAEANETALKLARKYARTVLGQDRWKFITAVNSFHGRTLGTIAATGQDKYKVGFEPLPPGFVHVPYDDVDAVAGAIDDQTCAVLVEPVQGEGGIIVPGEGYLAGLRELCTARNVLLILDEVQTGFGRTGTLFAWQRDGVRPDIFTMAKSFGGGLPLGGAWAAPQVAAAFVPGNHATTFGGNPVTCAAALAVLSIIEDEGLLERCRAMGARLTAGLEELRREFPQLTVAVRGRGLLIGLEMAGSGREVMTRCQDAGLLISTVQDKVLRFTPPLTVSADEVDEALSILRGVLADLPAEEPR